MSVLLDHVLRRHLEHYKWAAKIVTEARELPITEADSKAAWELYVELVTRVATQSLEDEEGVEATALQSIADLFGFARELMRRSGPGAAAFSAFALALLNHRLRPFTAPWHKRASEGRLGDPAMSGRFRDELRTLQEDLRIAADALTEIAKVPRLSDYSAP